MRTVVISGGTDGIGREIALTSLSRGENVVAVGRNPEKGRALLEAAAETGAGARAFFVEADLSLVSENRRVIEEITARFPTVDALVLCARHYLSRRRETPEGFEENFALFYLSRFLLSHGLAGALERAERPVIANVAGPGGNMSLIRWDDLELERGYDGGAALGQGGKLNDLLAVSFAEEHRAGRTRYALFHPGITATSFSGEYDEAVRPHIEAMKERGKPVRESAAPIIAVLDDPPAEPLSAFVEGRRISVEDASFDRSAAARLRDLTGRLLSR
ncbi:SDR family NAD(P)-dependent oxidoreductase [Streptosporangium carneum]|uniref:Oxidoreductase n=1 Tax=Streptosporangium carneum TaxID=47481 RepID=A0A9W6I1V1_9ACTN|nr:SDR family NAD(P)-dependent oxidoreductase [Streptosporangium carneum]GLK09469.1 hypothetical protein GCM10017600_28750 [Streptosporangium carneum]